MSCATGHRRRWSEVQQKSCRRVLEVPGAADGDWLDKWFQVRMNQTADGEPPRRRDRFLAASLEVCSRNLIKNRMALICAIWIDAVDAQTSTARGWRAAAADDGGGGRIEKLQLVGPKLADRPCVVAVELARFVVLPPPPAATAHPTCLTSNKHQPHALILTLILRLGISPATV